MTDSLWGNEFEISSSKTETQEILNKIKSEGTDINKEYQKILKSTKIPLEEKLDVISERVNQVLGKQKNNIIVIRDRDTLHKYITDCINQKIIAIDTETNNSLDYISCKLMGLCLYAPTLKQVYVPVNHCDFKTNERLKNQVTEKDIQEELQRVIDSKTFTVFHNGKFDYQVLKCCCNIEMNINYDSMIASQVLNENESASLKWQYIDKIDKEQEWYDIEGLFKGIKYEDISPDVFALYSATDSLMTYKLYEYQMNIFKQEDSEKLYKLFKNVEMPLVKVTAEMELNGIHLDKEYSERLSAKFHKECDRLQNLINIELDKLQPKVDAWRLTKEANVKESGKSKNEQLENPINLDSPTQLAILLYDVLKCPVIDKKQPRGTGKEILVELAKQQKLDLINYVIERKKLYKLVKDFVDALPKQLRADNKIHAHFNQMGAEEHNVKTGRFSSTDPNLQQIPSHRKEVRGIFKASDGCVLVGGDYSAQEPRLTAFVSQDKQMLKAYEEGKDLYSVIASLSFKLPYEDCLEFYPEGTKVVIDGKEIICGHKNVQNKSGKERRTQAKSILLGLLYGRGVNSVAEQIGKSKEEAQEIIDKFFTAFPTVEKWINDTHKKAKKNGYVEDWYGRRRRLPDILLPDYLIEPIKKTSTNSDFNPFLLCENRVNNDLEKKINSYREKLKKAKYKKDIDLIIADAKKNNLYIRSNSNLIAQAERQSVNAIIQGGAATLTKLAMINIFNDEELNRLGFKLLITIHDEVLGECPEENGQLVAKRLSEVMINTAKPYMNVPMSCDCYVVKNWYYDEISATILSEYKKLEEEDGLTREESFDKIVENHTEFTRDELYKIINS